MHWLIRVIRRDDEFFLLAAVFGVICLIVFWTDITEWLGALLPTGSGIARWIWQGIGLLLVSGVLSAVYFATGISGRHRPSGRHGIAGIATGFLLLLFAAAYLYSIGFALWFALLVGIAVSLFLKMLVAYWRTRIRAPAGSGAGTVQVAYRQRVVRRG